MFYQGLYYAIWENLDRFLTVSGCRCLTPELSAVSEAEVLVCSQKLGIYHDQIASRGREVSQHNQCLARAMSKENMHLRHA